MKKHHPAHESTISVTHDSKLRLLEDVIDSIEDRLDKITVKVERKIDKSIRFNKFLYICISVLYLAVAYLILKQIGL